MIRRSWTSTVAAATVLQGPAALAHGFGQRFDLPLPLWLWISGAAATILLSFVLMALFVRVVPERGDFPRYPRLRLRTFRVARWLTRSALLNAIRAAAVVAAVTTVAAALRGTQDPFRNVAPTMIWVIWWVGLAFVCALIGNLWALINPLRTIFVWAEAAWQRMGGGGLSLDLLYPEWLGAWPALVVFMGFAWTELVWLGRDVPFNLGVLLVVYAVWTWLGMHVYGKDVWLQHGEAFAVAFGILGRFAPVEVRVVDDAAAVTACPNRECAAKAAACVDGYVCLYRASAESWELNLRPPAVGLLNGEPMQLSRVVFVLAMLATVTFDGLIDTPFWLDTTNRVLASSSSPLFVAAANALDLEGYQLLNSAALVAMPATFSFVYIVCCCTMLRVTAASICADAAARAAAAPARGIVAIAGAFVMTLVPIAIAYHLAHYLSMLLTTGQFIIPLASDPFGAGWDLLGTAAYKVDLAIVGARFVWYSAVTAIVFGHVASVYLAHVVALEFFRGRRAALLSQVPMVVLMMIYTMTSLWILAQPIVG